MAGRVGLVLGLIAIVFLQLATAQKIHDVGGTTGWTIPPGGATFYSDWATRNSFSVGDSLRFNFQTSSHSVLEVESKESFDACTFDSANSDTIRTGPATVTLNETGMHYFVCTVGTHCSLGQKLAINVVSATAGGPMSPTTPSSRSPSSQPPPSSPSSSNALMATLYLTFSAMLMTFF